MNRWSFIAAVGALGVAVGGMWHLLYRSEGPSVSLEPTSMSNPSVARGAELNSDPAPPRVEVPTPQRLVATTRDSSVMAYDDSHLYRRETRLAALEPNAAGVLVAFERARSETGVCLDSARLNNPTLTSLTSVEVRIAAQDDETAAVEEVRLPSINDPSVTFRGCLVAALADARFHLPPGGVVRLTMSVELGASRP